MRTEFYLTESPWFILLCIIVGIAIAWLLYRKSNFFDKRTRLAVSVIRGAVLSILGVLLVGILVRYIQSTTEKTKAVILLDNSISMAPYGAAVIQTAEQYGAILREKGYEVALRSLEANNSDSLAFGVKTTDLSSALEKIRAEYEGLHLTDVIVLSDGIVNKGLSPSYSYYPFKVHTVAFGDTIPRVDAQISQVTANQVAYLGNDFPLAVDIKAVGMKGQSSRLFVKQDGKILHSKVVNFTSEDYFETSTFTLTASKKGLQHYTIELEAQQGEYSTKNNRKDFYIDVLDAQDKVLLLALAPHPDIKAIKAAIESTSNVEVVVKVASSIVDMQSLDKGDFATIILHQLPSISGVLSPYLEKLRVSDKSVFVIAGQQTSLPKLTEWFGDIVTLPKGTGQFDRVTGIYNQNSFQLFKLDEQKVMLLEKLPPLVVPYGDYQLRSTNTVLLYQKLNTLKTQKPLMVVANQAGTKKALLLGEGIWRWRLEEFAMTSRNEVVDDILQKVVQFLSIKEDKRKFRVYPKATEFELGDVALLNTEIYNDLYERSYGHEVSIKVEKQGEVAKEYRYTHTQEKPYFELSGLTEGIYQFVATAMIAGKEEKVTGQFRVVETAIELLSTQADYNLLRELSKNNNGAFSIGGNEFTTTEWLTGQKVPDKLKTKDDLVELIELKWILILLLLLLATEWGVRKYNGQY